MGKEELTTSKRCTSMVLQTNHRLWEAPNWVKKCSRSPVSIRRPKKELSCKWMAWTEGHVVYINITDGLISAKGNSLWSTEAWYTLNVLPVEKGVVVPSGENFAPNTLYLHRNKSRGCFLVFDGKKIDQWHNFKKSTIGKGWIIQDQAIHLNAIKEESGRPKMAAIWCQRKLTRILNSKMEGKSPIAGIRASCLM